MSDFVVAFGLVLVLEGVLYALFPEQMKRFSEMAFSLPPETLRKAGLAAAAFGVLIVWLVRGP